jgi:hypothetical protein
MKCKCVSVKFKLACACRKSTVECRLKPGIRVGGYDFPHRCDGPPEVISILKRPLVDVEFDMPVLH